MGPLRGNFNTILLGEELPQPMKEATVVVLSKAGKDPIFMQLLLTPYHCCIMTKILGKLLVSQLQSVFSPYINLDQTGFIKDKQMSDNI